MENATIYKHALALRGSGMRMPAIAQLLGKDRVTISPDSEKFVVL